MNYHISNVRLIDPYNDELGEIWLVEGRMKFQNPNIECEEIDGTGKILFPGFIDPHVHFRTPGDGKDETFETGSQAAASGGTTIVLDMPNTAPPTYDRNALTQKRAAIGKQSLVRWGIWFGAGRNIEELKAVANEVIGFKLFCNVTTGNLLTNDEAFWREVFQLGKPVITHAEGETFERLATVWEESGMPCLLHQAHVSSKREVDFLRQLKKKTEKVSAEACPHHLLLTKKDVERLGNFARMKPELGTEEDRGALWDAIEEGIINIFATDHAPHSKEKKERPEPCWGVPGVGERFSLLWTEWTNRGWDPRRFSDMMGGITAERFGLGDFGVLKENAIADVVLVNPETLFEIQAYQRPGMSTWSPYDGRRVKGNVENTWIAGVKIWDGKYFLDGFTAPEIRPKN
jgi:dihydroorotase-like cyclic amidohydrolase